MVQIGQFNILSVLHEVDFGFYLDGGQDGEILLPMRYAPQSLKPGEELDVFICYDSEDRLVATTDVPLAQVGQFAFLSVVEVNSVGAFLDWGLPKDLFVPYAEQIRPLKVGEGILVFIYLDNSDRIAASMRVERYCERGHGELQEGAKVELIIAKKTDLGFKAIINELYVGVLFNDEIFKPIRVGQKITGFIRRFREDGKIDLSLQQTGHQAADGVGPQIIELLKKNNGAFAINDKTPAGGVHR